MLLNRIPGSGRSVKSIHHVLLAPLGSGGARGGDDRDGAPGQPVGPDLTRSRGSSWQGSRSDHQIGGAPGRRPALEVAVAGEQGDWSIKIEGNHKLRHVHRVEGRRRCCIWLVLTRRLLSALCRTTALAEALWVFHPKVLRASVAAGRSRSSDALRVVVRRMILEPEGEAGPHE